MVVIAKIMIATDRDRDSLRFDLPVRRSTRKRTVPQVCDTGANFNADVALQTVLQPHLTTLAPGYTCVDAELKRLEGEGYLEFVDWLGFLPCRFI